MPAASWAWRAVPSSAAWRQRWQAAVAVAEAGTRAAGAALASEGGQAALAGMLPHPMLHPIVIPAAPRTRAISGQGGGSGGPGGEGPAGGWAGGGASMLPGALPRCWPAPPDPGQVVTQRWALNARRLSGGATAAAEAAAWLLGVAWVNVAGAASPVCSRRAQPTRPHCPLARQQPQAPSFALHGTRVAGKRAGRQQSSPAAPARSPNWTSPPRHCERSQAGRRDDGGDARSSSRPARGGARP